jgi:hypothetical protein
MSHEAQLSYWEEEVATRFPGLSKPQAAVLASYSFGIAVVRCCGLTTVATFLAELEGLNVGAVKQRLRELYLPKDKKCGDKRREVSVSALFGPLVDWMVGLLVGIDLAIALDATALGDRFVVLSVSMLFRGTAIPIAWTVIEAQSRGSWNDHWKLMLRTIRPHIPKTLNVIVLTDRGLWSRQLFRAIRLAGWHPFMRITSSGSWQSNGTSGFVPLSHLLPRTGTSLCRTGTAFKAPKSRLRCTLLAYRGESAEEPWLILTDIKSEGAEAVWYAMRFWIENGFRQLKRGVWQWQNTKITEPGRVERALFPVALATLWTVAVGAAAEGQHEVPGFEDLWVAVGRRPHTAPGFQPRRISVLIRGWIRIIVNLIKGRLTTIERLIPEPWPKLRPLATC